ncbi:lysostaphin resistance A-like protein [Thalassobius sp. S69A]|uniref:CPBP family intramembrane glutamic endopeptidase n=1 Tax=unclassified Thalassovita TaxID=2619711 RepID=UPI000C0EA04D|nr:CPBP family intramembrane metalloprotease domain-containing protein [Paracoccaceae bacterium]MBT26869.1 CPBP family intramembrane metalloprotease domain-containing protein [Paracoccaceae bacterium]
MRPAYAPHQEFLRPARPRSELWRLGLGLLTAFAIFAALQWGLGALLIATLSPQTLMEVQAQLALGNTPGGATMMLASFGLILVAVGLSVTHVHKRSALTLLGPKALLLPQFTRVLTALIALNFAIWILPPSEFLHPIEANLPLATWLSFLPLAVPALLIQVSAEEILFRGYLQQQLAVRVKSPLVWMVLPSLGFGLLHLRPDLPETRWILVAWATLFGMLAADLTARSGSLGPAIALHFVTNAMAILCVSSDDILSGLALGRMPVALGDPAQLTPYLLIDLGGMLCAWLAARLALRC